MSLFADAVVQTGVLNMHGAVMLAFTVVVFTAFILDRLPIATVSLAILALLPLGFALFPLETAQGLVDPGRFFAGFGHPALVAICSLMVLGHGLVVTGALEPVAHKLASWIESMPRMAPLALLLLPAAASGLVNDTPVVVLLIPLVIAAAARARMQAGKMLLPMNYAVLIGGMSTTIGTSTNLIVISLAVAMGVGPFGLFSFFPIVALAAIPAMIYLWLVAPRLLARVERPVERLAAQVFDADMEVEPGSWMDGRTLREVLSATGGRMRLLDLRRGRSSLARLPTLTLRPGDLLAMQDTMENLKEYEKTLHGSLHGLTQDAEDAEVEGAPKAPSSAMLAQMIVTPESPLAGYSMRQRRVADRYGVVVVGLRPRNATVGWQREDMAGRTIHTGDILLVQGPEAAIQAAQIEGLGLLLDERFTLPRQEKAGIALLTMAGVVLLAATKTLPIALAALSGVMVLLATRCLSWKDVVHSLSVKVVLLVAGSLALGDALEVSGATSFLAQQVAGLSQDLSPGAVLVVLMGLMGLLTNFVSNNAAAAIGTPLGIELARLLGVPPEPMVLAVLFGCNLCYLTPMGYQTNLLVMNAGNYRFRDFVIVGTPLFAIMWAGLSYGLIRFYGL